jgi:hypothetical protein
MLKKVLVWCGIVAMLSVMACNRQDSETAEQQTQTPETPMQAAAPAAPAVKSGTVLETMDAGGYTYLLVDDGVGQNWLAVLKTKVEVGQEVSYYDGMVMENFVSKTLDRTFDKIIFSNGLVDQQGEASGSFAEAVSGEGTGMEQPAAMGGSKKAIVPFSEIQVEKAAGENAYSVGEVFEKATDLDGQMITVRGKVVKVSKNIMGVNWLHIQDGTGAPDSNTHDLVVTTSIMPDDAWDIVTVKGVVSANKDFGAGYSYAVIMEEAEVSE